MERLKMWDILEQLEELQSTKEVLSELLEWLDPEMIEDFIDHYAKEHDLTVDKFNGIVEI